MSDKIGRSAALDLQHKLSARLPAEVVGRIRWLQPFMTNHSVTLECFNPDGRAAKQVADNINISLSSDAIYINGRPIRAAIPRRRGRRT